MIAGRGARAAALRTPWGLVGASSSLRAVGAKALHVASVPPQRAAPCCRHAPCRCFSSTTADAAISKFSDDFAEAQLLLGDAEEVVGTTYFEDDLAEAKEMTESVLKQYDALVKADETLEKRFGLSIRGLKDKLEALEEQLH